MRDDDFHVHDKTTAETATLLSRPSNTTSRSVQIPLPLVQPKIDLEASYQHGRAKMPKNEENLPSRDNIIKDNIDVSPYLIL